MDGPARSKGRKYGFACLVCRRRKVKCDGRRPTCINCARLKETCSYKEKSAYTSYVSEELRAAQARVQELQRQIRELAALDSATRDRRLADLVSQLDLNEGDQEGMRLGTEQVCPSTTSWTEETLMGEDVSYDESAEFSVDTEGRQHYFGATSRFHPVPDHDHQRHARVESHGPEIQELESYHQKWLYSNARFQDSWERMAHMNMSRYTDVKPSVCVSLLQIYWSWQAPLHNCIYRRCFYRDMALGGPYFSRFLLHVIFAHACRHMPENDHRFASFERGETFLRDAMLLLIEEMKQSRPRIPTIQGLLILGGRQCAVGKSSEGWLYTGMAIRMINDLGLHIKRSHASLIKEFEPDDLEVRKRLYLSVYAWDKSISLCLGRPPSLKHTPYQPSALHDDDLWQPPRLLDTDKLYPETKCHSTLTFIINESYNAVYKGPARNIDPKVIFELERKLAQFHQNLPDSLKIGEGANVQICVPPHILCLKPFFVWCWDPELRENPLALRAQVVCTEQAAAVNDLFKAYGRLFNFQYQSYLISYCVYTAATIDVRLVRHNDKALAEMATTRLAITLRMLETEVRQTPGIRRSIEIIRSQIGAPSTSSPHHQIEGSTDAPHAKEIPTGMSVDSMIGTTPHMALPPPTVSDTNFFDSSTEHVGAGPPQMPISEESNLPLESEWAGWNMDDFGGGFVPDMAYWTSFDQHF
ncbi:nitrogen assimilation transcription factor nirA [Penicillium brasilianum]|uniref:Nitrogen assimilation transcription factor nirA n=1 Tax=Penicillium brasilianum TaxID=104259 RepID=A0A1S9RHK6_PENBI|nr:nitrogen assimilation transcription factor nirA [Penicillium brasilianum]